MLAYAIPSLEDLHNAAVPFFEALVGNVVIWAISLAPLLVAVRCILFALRKGRSGPNLVDAQK